MTQSLTSEPNDFNIQITAFPLTSSPSPLSLLHSPSSLILSFLPFYFSLVSIWWESYSPDFLTNNKPFVFFLTSSTTNQEILTPTSKKSFSVNLTFSHNLSLIEWTVSRNFWLRRNSSSSLLTHSLHIFSILKHNWQSTCHKENQRRHFSSILWPHLTAVTLQLHFHCIQFMDSRIEWTRKRRLI